MDYDEIKNFFPNSLIVGGYITHDGDQVFGCGLSLGECMAMTKDTFDCYEMSHDEIPDPVAVWLVDLGPEGAEGMDYPVHHLEFVARGWAGMYSGSPGSIDYQPYSLAYARCEG